VLYALHLHHHMHRLFNSQMASSQPGVVQHNTGESSTSAPASLTDTCLSSSGLKRELGAMVNC
jgi:hypothetical protein